MAVHCGPRLEIISIVTSNLILYLDAGLTTSYPGSGTTWTDLSGNNNNATLVNSPTFDSANSGSFSFDGVNDYVTTNITTTYPDFTLSCWYYHITSSAARRNIMSKSSFFATAENDWPVSLHMTGSVLECVITSGLSYFITGPTAGSIVSSSLLNNTWYNIASTYDRSSFKLYINGSLVQTVSNTITPPNNTGRSWTIGRAAFEFSGGVNNSFLTGKLATAKIYNAALSQADVTQNFNALKTRFGL